MQLSDEISQKLINSCKVIQLFLPFLTISCLILLGFVFLDFSGPMLMNKQSSQGSLFLAGLAFFAATICSSTYQRFSLAKMADEQSTIAEPQAVRAARIIQYSVIVACVGLMLAAYSNILAFRTTKDVVHLVVTGFLLVAIVCRIPTQSSFRQKINEFLSQRIGMKKDQ